MSGTHSMKLSGKNCLIDINNTTPCLSHVPFTCDRPNMPNCASVYDAEINMNMASADKINIKDSTVMLKSNLKNNHSYNMRKIRPLKKTVRFSNNLCDDNAKITPVNVIHTTISSNRHDSNKCKDSKSNDFVESSFDAKTIINSNTFWSTYKVSKSKGDGHCLIHSIISSMNSQHATNLNHSLLLHDIEVEVENNAFRYLPAIEGFSHDLLKQQMKAYLIYKVYNSSFGDVVPLTIANILKVDVIVIYNTGNTYDCHRLSYEGSYKDQGKAVFIYKSGEHYDGIELCISERSSSNSTANSQPINREYINTWCRDHISADRARSGNSRLRQYNRTVYDNDLYNNNVPLNDITAYCNWTS